MTENDEPVERPAEDATTDRHPAAWRRALPLATVLVVIAIAAIGVGTWLWADPPATPQQAESSDRQDAVLSAERFASTLTSYDATKTDAYVDSLTGMLADGKDSPCWNQVSSLVPAVADSTTQQAAAQRQQLYDGTVRERAVETIDPNSARVMLALDYQMSAIVKKQRATLAAQPLRMRMDLKSHDGDWLVDTCTIVAPEPADGGAQ